MSSGRLQITTPQTSWILVVPTTINTAVIEPYTKIYVRWFVSVGGYVEPVGRPCFKLIFYVSNIAAVGFFSCPFFKTTGMGEKRLQESFFFLLHFFIKKSTATEVYVNVCVTYPICSEEKHRKEGPEKNVTQTELLFTFQTYFFAWREETLDIWVAFQHFGTTKHASFRNRKTKTWMNLLEIATNTSCLFFPIWANSPHFPFFFQSKKHIFLV